MKEVNENAVAAEAAAAAAAQAKADAKAKADAEKAQLKAAKLKAAIESAGVNYTNATNIATGLNSATTALPAALESGDVAQVEQLHDFIKDNVKAIKAEQKTVTGLLRSHKDSEELKAAVESLVALIAPFDKLLEDAKEAKKVVKGKKRELDQQAKQAAKEAKANAEKMPEQNGVRRPKPDTLCGKAWALFDECSRRLASPVPVNFALTLAPNFGLNEGNVKTEYARWKKFNGVEGRIDIPLPEVLKDIVLPETTVAVEAGKEEDSEQA